VSRGSWDRVGAQIDDLTAAVRALAERVHEPRESIRMLGTALDKLEASQARTQAQLSANIGSMVDRLATLASGRAGSGRDLRIGTDAAPREERQRGRNGDRRPG